MILRLITAPTDEPLDLETEVKAHLRVDHKDEDARIYGLMKAARQALENERGIALLTQTWEVVLTGFDSTGLAWPGSIVLPRPPLQSVTSVSYLDANGVSQAWSSSLYTVVNPAGFKARRAYITPAFGEVYPTTHDVPNAVTIRFVAGFGDTYLSVPEPLRQAMLLHIGEMYRDREQSVVGTIVNMRPTYDRLVQSCVEIAA